VFTSLPLDASMFSRSSWCLEVKCITERHVLPTLPLNAFMTSRSSCASRSSAYSEGFNVGTVCLHFYN
jgi:hypothetical protein